MNTDRRTFAKSLTVAAIGSAFRPWDDPIWAQAAQAKTPPSLARAAAALPKAIVTKIRVLTPSTGSSTASMNRSFSQSGMLVTVETDIGITGIGEGVARSDSRPWSHGEGLGQRWDFHRLVCNFLPPQPWRLVVFSMTLT